MQIPAAFPRVCTATPIHMPPPLAQRAVQPVPRANRLALEQVLALNSLFQRNRKAVDMLNGLRLLKLSVRLLAYLEASL